jgi:hypothetical protein
MLYLLKVLSDLFRRFYIPALGRLITAAEQNNDLLLSPSEVHPEAWAIVDTQFRDAAPYRPAVPKITSGDTADTGVDNRLCYPVSQAPDPRFEVLCFPYRYHVYIVSYRIRKVKRFFGG